MSIQGICDASFRVANAFSTLSSAQAANMALFLGGAALAVSLNTTGKYEDTTEKASRIAFTAFLGGLCPFALLAAGEFFLNATAFMIENHSAAIETALKVTATSAFQALQFLDGLSR
jgi:hypothetical protein